MKTLRKLSSTVLLSLALLGAFAPSVFAMNEAGVCPQYKQIGDKLCVLDAETAGKSGKIYCIYVCY